MPDVTDTGTVIGTIKPQNPLLEPPMPIGARADDKTASGGGGGNGSGDRGVAMDVDAACPSGDGEDAVQLLENLRSDDAPSRVEAARRLPVIA